LPANIYTGPLGNWEELMREQSVIRPVMIGFLGIVSLSIVGCQTQTLKNANQPDTLTTGENRVEIESGNNLEGYHDIISGKKPPDTQIITGKLYIPKKCGTEKMPAVIIQHGSGNPKKPWYRELSMALNEIGVIALVPDSLSSRGMTETASNQSRLSKATRLFDTFSAFRYLQSIRCVDAKRIGITGYSFGGIIARDSVEKKLAEKLGNGHVYKASLPVYPSCQANFKNSVPTKTKVHLLVAGADDYTPAKYCIENVKTKKTQGWDIEITVLDGVHHGFINADGPKRYWNSWTFGGCGWSIIDDDGYSSNDKYGISMRDGDGWSKAIKTLVQQCAKKGVTAGGSKETVKRTLDFTVQFFRDNL